MNALRKSYNLYFVSLSIKTLWIYPGGEVSMVIYNISDGSTPAWGGIREV